MSYEGTMLKNYKMPLKKEVEEALLTTLFKHNGVIKEFSSNEEIVDEIANIFNLDENQRSIALERIYYKENRIVKTPLWHRLLYRAADFLAKQKLITRPTTTFQITNKKEWMLTENGYDKALRLMIIPIEQKENFTIKSFEVQKIVKKMFGKSIPDNYDPVNKEKAIVKITRELTLRNRSFRQAILEAYDYGCAFCGMKLCSPDTLSWEVEAAHIVPHSEKGKDDIWNGLALCHLHHWAFDTGWFTLQNDYKIVISPKVHNLPVTFGKMGEFNFIRFLSDNNKIRLPKSKNMYPHINALKWHRVNRFYNKIS